MKRFTTRALFFALFTFLILHIFLALAETWWFFELFTHYALYSLNIGLLCLLASLLLKHWRLALLFTLSLSINLATLAPYLTAPSPLASASAEVPASAQITNEQEPFTLLSFNFFYQNDNFEEFATLLKQENPDIFIIHEAGPQWKDGVALFTEDYPYYFLTQATGIHGILIASKTPGAFREIPLGRHSGLEFIPATSLLSKLDPFPILGVHPSAPISETYAEDRNTELKDIASYAQNHASTVIIGDFNATPWSPHMRDLIKTSGLRDARLLASNPNHSKLEPTWHANNPLFRLPIDHALLTSNLTATDFHTGTALSSDHWPIVVTLQSH